MAPRVNAERDNLRAAVYWALDRDAEADATLALRIIAPFAYEAIMDPPGGVGAWAERALERAAGSTVPQRMAVFGTAAYEAQNLADHDAITARAAEALRDGVDIHSIAPSISWFALNGSLNQQGKQDEAQRNNMEAARELERLGIDAFGCVMLYCAASYYAVEAGDLTTAQVEAESALRIARQIGNPSALMSGLCNLARSVAHDDPARALGAFEEAIALGRAGATELMMGVALVGVARLRALTQDRLAALEALREALLYSNHVGFRPIVVEVIGPGAEVLIHVGRMTTAVVVAGSVLQGSLAQIMVSSERNADLERLLVQVRDELGDEEYDRAFARGVAMSYEEIVDFAIAELHVAIKEVADA